MPIRLDDRLLNVGFKVAKTLLITSIALTLYATLTGPDGCLERYNIPQRIDTFIERCIKPDSVETTVKYP